MRPPSAQSAGGGRRGRCAPRENKKAETATFLFRFSVSRTAGGGGWASLARAYPLPNRGGREAGRLARPARPRPPSEGGQWGLGRPSRAPGRAAAGWDWCTRRGRTEGDPAHADRSTGRPQPSHPALARGSYRFSGPTAGVAPRKCDGDLAPMASTFEVSFDQWQSALCDGGPSERGSDSDHLQGRIHGAARIRPVPFLVPRLPPRAPPLLSRRPGPVRRGLAQGTPWRGYIRRLVPGNL